MTTEEDREEERDRLGNDPLDAPPAEELEAENPVESPAADQEDEGESDRESDQARASSSLEPARPVGKSTEGLTVGGTEKTPD